MILNWGGLTIELWALGWIHLNLLDEIRWPWADEIREPWELMDDLGLWGLVFINPGTGCIIFGGTSIMEGISANLLGQLDFTMESSKDSFVLVKPIRVSPECFPMMWINDSKWAAEKLGRMSSFAYPYWLGGEICTNTENGDLIGRGRKKVLLWRYIQLLHHTSAISLQDNLSRGFRFFWFEMATWADMFPTSRALEWP